MTLSELYYLTTPVLALENFLMGGFLLFVYLLDKHQKLQYRPSILLFSIIMLQIAFINLFEFIFSENTFQNAASVLLFVASLQLVSFFYAFAGLINHNIINRKTISVNLLLIAVFTIPSICINELNHPLLGGIFYYMGVLFYSTKLVLCVIRYYKLYHEAKAKISNFYSEENSNLLNWINSIIYTVVAIGCISVIVPFTNYAVLIGYQIFLFVAYFFIYNSILYHAPFFQQIDMAVIPPLGFSAFPATSNNAPLKLPIDFMHERESVYNKWIAHRGYAKPGVTIDDVARALNTNRTTFSVFLNTELEQNFYEWISTLRIEEAKRLLINQPGTPIIDIAISVGIEDRSNFDKIFKRIVGVSPATYRKTPSVSTNTSC